MFEDVYKKYDWNEIKDFIYSRTELDVQRAINNKSGSLEDFMALISPAASNCIEQMAQISQRRTQNRYGKIMQLYIPLYLSNECSNQCLYCGFSNKNKIERTVLTKDQILKEIEVIKSYGYEHILLVTGEHERKAGIEYFKEVIKLIKPHFSLISMEVQPLEKHEYEELLRLGLHTVYVYQETYNKETYPRFHPAGKKADFFYRLATPDRLGQAGVHRIGLGNLIGLEDWRVESFFTALHLKYLEKTYWKTKYSISFPRLRPHEGAFMPDYVMSDKELVQLICAYRILNDEVELSISVRESKKFRDNIIKLGITSMSAGSKTEPGGYSGETKVLKQFEVHDDRSPKEIEEMIKANGYEAVWKDWSIYLQE